MFNFRKEQVDDVLFFVGIRNNDHDFMLNLIVTFFQLSEVLQHRTKCLPATTTETMTYSFPT